jgi:hypothetical protein
MIETVAAWMAELAEWSPEERRAEVDTFCASARFAPA